MFKTFFNDRLILLNESKSVIIISSSSYRELKLYTYWLIGVNWDWKFMFVSSVNLNYRSSSYGE